MKNQKIKNEDCGEIIIYKPSKGKTGVEVKLVNETLWLDAHQMAALFQRDRSVILRHIRNIYNTKELSSESTCAKNAQVAMTLMIAESKPKEKDVITAMLTNLIGM